MAASSKHQTRPDDPEVKIPQAVRDAAARSEALLRAQFEDPNAPPANNENNGENDGGTPPPAETAGGEATQQEAAPPTETPAPPPADDGQSWEHRYNSMKGRYEGASRTIKELTDRVKGLENVISTLQVSQVTQPGTPAPAPAPAPTKLITPEEESDYGSDFLTVVGKKAREELLPEVAQLRQTVAQLQNQLGTVAQVTVRSAREDMLNTLDREVANWKELNKNPDFLDWLSLPDRYSGVIRQNMLTEAFERNDAPRVANFFKGFLAEEAATVPQDRQPAPGQQAPKVSLDNLAAPGRAKSAAATNAPAEKPIITRQQISAFYADVAAGRYNGRDKEKKAHEVMIFEAQADGRIR